MQLSQFKSTLSIIEIKATSLTELRHQMRSSDLLLYLSLNRFSSGLVRNDLLYKFCPKSNFQECQLVRDTPTDGWTDRRIDGRTLL